MFSEKQFLRKIDIFISAVSCYVNVLLHVFKPVLLESYQRGGKKNPYLCHDIDHEGSIKLT